MRKLIVAAIAAAIFIAPAAVMAQSPIIIKFSHVVANEMNNLTKPQPMTPGQSGASDPKLMVSA